MAPLEGDVDDTPGWPILLMAAGVLVALGSAFMNVWLVAPPPWITP